MKNQLVLFITLTSLIFAFANSGKAQTPSSTPQIYQGCAKGPFTYKFPPKKFIWGERGAKGILKRILINEIVSSDFKMAFTFVPEKVMVVKNSLLSSEDNSSDKDSLLKLEVFSYGRETVFGKTDLQNLLALKSLKLPPIAEMPEFKKSHLEEEDYQYMNWDGTPLETMRATGRWFAIIHRKSDFANGLIPNILPVISPAIYLGKDSIPTELVPPTLYKYRGEVIKVTGIYDPNNREKAPSIPSAIRIVELTSNGSSNNRYNFTLDTSGLEPGDYYVTLQGDATFDGQNLENCSKTTPPVVITVKEKTIEILRPELKLDPYVSCPPFHAEITAEAVDKNYPARKLTIKNWKLRDEKGTEISPTYYDIKPISEKSQKLIVNKILENGKYFVETTVSNGTYDTLATTDFIINCPPPSGRAAGIAYFGNATPNYRKGEIIRNSEEWTKDTEKRNKKPIGAGKYPSKEYEEFYKVTGAGTPLPIDPELNNTNTIKRIVDILEKYPVSNLYILGYTDYRATKTKNFFYRNDLLAEFRVKSVVQVIREELIRRNLSPERIIGASTTFINCSDKTATVDTSSGIWSDTQRWDRRVEIIFGYGALRPERPSYARQCPDIDINLSR